MTMLRLPAVLLVLAATSATVASQAPALRVISATPNGELTELADGDQVRVLFSEPMVELGTVPTGRWTATCQVPLVRYGMLRKRAS